MDLRRPLWMLLIFKSDKHNTFVSIEPILEPFDYPDIPPALLDDWYIIGAETGSRAEKVVPERKWVENIVQLCGDNGKPLFMKDSMKGIWATSSSRSSRGRRSDEENHT